MSSPEAQDQSDRASAPWKWIALFVAIWLYLRLAPETWPLVTGDEAWGWAAFAVAAVMVWLSFGLQMRTAWKAEGWSPRVARYAVVTAIALLGTAYAGLRIGRLV